MASRSGAATSTRTTLTPSESTTASLHSSAPAVTTSHVPVSSPDLVASNGFQVMRCRQLSTSARSLRCLRQSSNAGSTCSSAPVSTLRTFCSDPKSSPSTAAQNAASSLAGAAGLAVLAIVDGQNRWCWKA